MDYRGEFWLRCFLSILKCMIRSCWNVLLIYNKFGRHDTINCTLLPFHTKNGRVCIGPNGFWIGAKKCHFPEFRGTGGTTAIIGRYYRLQTDTGLYYRSVWVVRLLDKARRLSSSGTTAWEGRYHRLTRAIPPPDSINYWRYHRQVWVVPPPKTLRRPSPKRCHHWPWWCHHRPW